MNDIIKAMEERRSIRKFKAEMPKKEDLEQKAKEYWRPWREDGADRDY